MPIGEVGYYAVDLAPWSETAITWNNWGHPSQATFLGSRLDVVPFSWIELDVSAAIDPSGGVLTLGLAAGGSSDVGGQDFYSRESVHSPELVIRYE